MFRAKALTRGAIGFGSMGLTGSYGPISGSDARRVIDRALDLGVCHIDTAASYGDGENERLVGRSIAGRRGAVFVATKCGVRWAGGGLQRDGSPAGVTAGVRESLMRLGVETLDLVYLHRVDPAVPIEESVGALKVLQDRGDVLAIGLSEASAATIRRAASVAPIAALQSEYSLLTRDLEVETIPVLRELGVALVAYSPLARGLLGGDLLDSSGIGRGDFRRLVPRFQGANLGKNLGRVAALHEIARARGAQPAQVALAWLMAQDHDVIPIPGTTRLSALEQNVAAASLRLEPDELRSLSDAFPVGSAVGDRSPESMRNTLDN